MTAIKICGLTNYADAQWAWRCGADLLGFIFVPASRRYLPPARAAQIIRALSDAGCTAQYVGVFADEPLESCRAVADACALSLIQLHGQETPAYAAALGRPAIVARRVRERVPWDELAQYRAWACLLDSFQEQALGGSGQTWRWELLRADDVESRGGGMRLILAGGLTPANVGEAIAQVAPWGVDVCSGVESAPGHKDAQKVQRFVQKAKATTAIHECGHE